MSDIRSKVILDPPPPPPPKKILRKTESVETVTQTVSCVYF